MQAVENIGRIAAVAGIDAVLLGPYDLSASLGRMGQLDHPSVTQAIDHVIETCRAAGLPLGMFGLTAAAVLPWAQRGCTLLIAGGDTLLLGHAAQAALAELR